AAEPFLERRPLDRLPEAEIEEAAVVSVGPVVGELQRRSGLGLVPTPVEQRSDEIRRDRDQLQAFGSNRGHGSRLQFGGHTGATWFRRGRFSGRVASRGPRSAS